MNRAGRLRCPGSWLRSWDSRYPKVPDRIGTRNTFPVSRASGRLTWPSRFIHVAHVNGLGNFDIPSVLPGRYLALALPDNTATDVDLDWLDEMRAAAVPITVTEGQTSRVLVPAGR